MDEKELTLIFIIVDVLLGTLLVSASTFYWCISDSVILDRKYQILDRK